MLVDNELAPSFWGITSILFSPDGSLLFASTEHGFIFIWNHQAGSQLERIKAHYYYINDISIAPDGQSLISASGDRTLKRWDISKLYDRSACE